MKNKISSLVLVTFFILGLQECYSQNTKISKEQLIGVWQEKTEKIGTSLLDNYQFFPTGEFIFNITGYDEINRIVSIKGKYSLSNDTLYFKVESTDEIVGGEITRNNLTSIHNSWSFTNYKHIIVQQNGTFEQIAIIELCDTSLKSMCIYIDNNKFYKISDNPKKFD